MTVQDKRMPKAIRRRPDGIELDWDGGGDVVFFGARELRLACPCAGCIDEMTRRPLLDPESVPVDVSPAAIELVGGYGLRVRWSDGHSTGIYTFDWFRTAKA
jgi:ATP-binding protein involved in chromosome partitioning